MRAIRVSEFGDPSVLRLLEVPDLSAGPDEVLIEIRAVGINPVETYVRSGVYANKPALPFTPGSDAAGVVLSVGSEVSGWSPGDRVYTSGSKTGVYAEQAICSPEHLHRLPDEAGFEQGAAVNVPYATAYQALVHRAEARAGETVLVHGATGGVGIAAVQIAHSLGLRVFGTGGTDEGRRRVVEEGAELALDHRSPDYLNELMGYTEGRGVDLILEMLANVNLSRDLSVLARRGRVVVIGCRGPIEINPRDAMVRDASILGMILYNASPEEYASTHEALIKGLAAGTFRPVVQRSLPLAEAARAHEWVMQPGALGKIVLIP